MSERFEESGRTRIARRPQRARYDKASVFAVLDSALVAHIGYVNDGQPHVTASSFWREGDTLYWHGSRASRMIAAQAEGVDVCVAVSHLDGLVLGRTGFTHSVLYRSAVAFGRTTLIDDIGGKTRAMDAFIERLYPGRAATLRPYHRTELAQISVIAMTIEDAAAKIRDGGVNEREEDFAFPAWAGVLRLRTHVASVEPDIRTVAPPPAPQVVDAYATAGEFGAMLARNAVRS
jgi:nitroimidazol reductase NimA-like FMN-containing flavoprotein (pyridoxamine 5'-phosphate oxidase superfamily)